MQNDLYLSRKILKRLINHSRYRCISFDFLDPAFSQDQY